MAKSHLLPADNEVFLDHIGLFVPDLAAAAPRLQQLGFNLTPEVAHSSGDPPVPSGTSNRCAMFQQGYLEVLGPSADIPADTPLVRQLCERLQRYAGLHLIAYAVADAEAAHGLLPERGFDPLPLVRLQRPVATASGESSARFDVIRLPAEAMPEGRIQMLTHHSPELVWQPHLLAQPNGATALAGVLICADDPAQSAERFGRFLNVGWRYREGRAELDLERGATVWLHPENLRALRPGISIPGTPYIAELALRSTDLNVTAAFLRQQQIEFQSLPAGALYISPPAALGMGVLFHSINIEPYG